MKEDYVYLVDVGVAAAFTYVLLWANDLWGCGGGLDQLVLGSAAQLVHHWMAVFLVPVFLAAWWLLRRNRFCRHAFFTLILVCLLLFFSEWVLVSPVHGAMYWLWIYAQMGGLM